MDLRDSRDDCVFVPYDAQMLRWVVLVLATASCDLVIGLHDLPCPDGQTVVDGN
jgi:hypothetical protein